MNDANIETGYQSTSRPVNKESRSLVLGNQDFGTRIGRIGTDGGIDGSRRDYIFHLNPACFRIMFLHYLVDNRNPFGSCRVQHGMNSL